MSIAHYIKVIGRGKDGARPITREQACDLFGQVLDGTVTDLEIGGFCLAMRIKGETSEEMAGFLDATYQRMQRFPASDQPVVVLPSYNGARKLPVLVHGTATESSRIFTSDVLSVLDIHALTAIRTIANGEVAFAATELLCPGLKRLLDVRRAVGLRNPAHSLVKIMNPCLGKALVVCSYTHAEYAISMGQVFELIQANALLLRGTEGEVVADARRMPQMEAFIVGRRTLLQEGVKGTLPSVPDLPKEIDAASTAAYIQSVLAGKSPLPASIAQQVEHILRVAKQL